MVIVDIIKNALSGIWHLKPGIFLLCFIFQAFAFAQDYNILDFGAKGDGMTLNTASIQFAIDAAHVNGGGRVIIPSGVFLSGSIILKSNIELHLLENAVLLGSTKPEEYKKLNRLKSLILADGQTNIALTGHGIIDGQGRRLALNIDSLFYAGKIDSTDYDFVEMRPSYYVRPQLTEFVKCKNIQVRNVTLKNAAFWVHTHEQCENIVIDSVRIESDAYWNNDGIDIVDCKNVRITNCFVNAADDGICLKSQSPDHLCDSIYIGNCTVRSSANAIKFGTVSHGGFKNVVIENIKVFDTFRSALAIECVDGGVIENILVDNINASNTGNALFIRLGDRNKLRPPGTIKNIIIRNMKVDVAFERPDYAYAMRGPPLPFFHNISPSPIAGIPGHPVQNVTLENIEINFPGRGNNGLANMPLSRLDAVPEKEDFYPEFSMFGELPAWGFYIRHVDGLTLKNISLNLEAPDYRHPFVFDDALNVEIRSLNIHGEAKPNHIILHKTEKIKIDNENCVLKL